VDDVLISVTEGRIGRRAQNLPIPLGLYATPTIFPAGFPGNTFRAASACHCPPPTQVYRANTRIIHTLTNTNTGVAAVVRITYSGCFYFVDKCPPQQDLDRVRRHGAMFESSPLILEPDWDCLPPPLPPEPAPAVVAAPKPKPKPKPKPPEPPKVVAMWRPPGAYFGPGSAPNIPWNLSYGRDQYGKVHVVVRNTGTGAFVRFATHQESPSWARTYAQQASGNPQMEPRSGGMSGLGFRSLQGDWERI
jgi:hypothetical protein